MIVRLLLALAFAAPVFAQPAPYTAEYEVLRNDKPLGQGTVTLAPEGDTWVLSSVTRGPTNSAPVPVGPSSDL